MDGRWALYAAFVTLAATGVRIGDGDETQPLAPGAFAAALADRKIARANDLNSRAGVPGLRMEDRKNWKAPPPGMPPGFEPPVAQVDDMAVPGLRMEDRKNWKAPPAGWPPGYEAAVEQEANLLMQGKKKRKPPPPGYPPGGGPDVIDYKPPTDLNSAAGVPGLRMDDRKNWKDPPPGMPPGFELPTIDPHAEVDDDENDEEDVQLGFKDFEEGSEVGAQVDTGTKNFDALARAKASNARPLVSDMDDDSEEVMDEDDGWDDDAKPRVLDLAEGSEQGVQVDVEDKTKNMGRLGRLKAWIGDNWNQDYKMFEPEVGYASYM